MNKLVKLTLPILVFGLVASPLSTLKASTIQSGQPITSHNQNDNSSKYNLKIGEEKDNIEYFRITSTVKSDTNLTDNKISNINILDTNKDVINEVSKKITKEEYEKETSQAKIKNHLNLNSSISLGGEKSESTKTNWAIMTTAVLRETHTKYKLTNSIHWLRAPFIGSTDFLTVHMNEGFSPTSGTQHFIQTYKVNFAGKYNYFINKSPNKGFQWLDRGLSAAFTLGGGYRDSSEDIIAKISVEGYLSDSSYVNVFGNYCHTSESISVVPTVSISGANVTLSPAISTDKMPNTNIQFYGK